MKKFFAILMSLALMLSLAVPAMADGETTYTITINNEANDHTYKAYQIFTGVLSGDPEAADGTTSAKLSDIQWGTGIKDSSQNTLLTFNGTGYDSAAKLADALTDDNIVAFADAVVPHLSEVAATSTDKGDYYEIY